MPIYKGTYYSRTFLFMDEAGAPLDITGWEFRAMFRANKTDPNPPLLELTSANGGWTVIDGPGGELQMMMSSVQTPDLDATKVVFDVLRTLPTPQPIWLFEGSVPVKSPITHDD